MNKDINNRIKQIIDDLFPDKTSSFEFIYAGINSMIYKFSINDDIYKIKISKIDSFQRTLREKDAMRLLSKLQIPYYNSPIFCTLDEQLNVGILISKWINGKNFQSTEDTNIIEIIQFLTKIHNITINNYHTIKNDCWGASSIGEMKACIDYQLRFLNKDIVYKYEKYLADFYLFSKYDNPHGYRCLCHMDNNFSNFIVVNDSIFALDWEYSGVSDPTFDLAQFLTHPSICLNSDFDYLDALSHYNKFSNYIKIDTEWYNYLFSSMILWWLLHIEKHINTPLESFSKNIKSFKSQRELLYQREKYFEKVKCLTFN